MNIEYNICFPRLWDNDNDDKYRSAVVIAGARYWASSQAAAVRRPTQGPVVTHQARNNTTRPRLYRANLIRSDGEILNNKLKLKLKLHTANKSQ